jgi:Uma2 family endonuclease
VSVTEAIHRITVDEYLHIVRDLGWESTELIEGVVYDVTPEHNRHSRTVMHVLRALDAAMPVEATFNTGSVRLSPRSLVDPDIYVVDDASDLDPGDVVPASAVRLVVEVSVTTQAHDRGVKLAAYADAGIPEVWLIDPRPEVGELLRHRDSAGGSYRTVDRFDVGENAAGLDVRTILAG